MVRSGTPPPAWYAIPSSSRTSPNTKAACHINLVH